MKTLSLMASGFKDSFEIIGHAISVALKNTSGRIKIFTMLFFVLMIIILSFNIPTLLTIAIGQNTDVGNTNVFEVFLDVVNTDNGKAVLSYYILGVFVFTLFTPVASNSLLSIYNKTSMVSIKKNDVHKVTDSIILQLISITNLLVFFSTIVICSVYSYSYGYDVRIYLVGFMIWAVGLSLTGFNGWSIELALRKWGPYAKFTLIALWAVLVVAIYFTSYTGSMPIYFVVDAILNSFTNLESTVIALLFLATLSFAIIYATFKMGIYTINNTAPFVSDKVKKVNKNKVSNQLALSLRVLWRSGNIRSPIIMMTIVSLGTVTFVAHSRETIVGIILAAPMVVTMSAAVNFFGIIGSGNSWIFTIPNFSRKIVESIFYYNILISFMVNLLAVIPATLLGYLPYELSVSFMICSVTSIIIITLIGIRFSILKPSKYDVHIRGENILSPSKSLTVLLTIISLGGIPVALLFFYTGIIIQFIVMVMVGILSLFLVRRYTKMLNNGYVINNIISQTS